MQNTTTRTRRKLVIAGGVVAACGALAVSGVLTANAATRPNAPAPAQAAPAAPAVAPAAAQDPEPAPWGRVEKSGLTSKGAPIVFYGVKIDEKALPQTHFGVMAGIADAKGVHGLNETNEFEGPDDAPGFHGVSAPIGVNGYDLPAFGYYAGPVAKITAKIHGKATVAHQVAWSVNPNVVIFWFDQGSGDPAGLAAFDAKGKQLPTGNSSVGHG